MARSGSENRQRQIALKARFTEAEAALVRAQADAAGVPVAGLIRYAVLGQTPLRATSTPPADRQEVARLVAALGTLASDLREAAAHADDETASAAVIAAQRDLAELRVAVLRALGREP